ncbi:MAG TPA: alpha-amylase family glycosyl hydrolase, partial [Trueperaceae bacterium]|nr:alpha-amylase family glycosyl hydrolase [Trueperaceae bacterium]
MLTLPPGLSAARVSLHVEREARARYGFPADAFTLGGRLLEVDFGEAERIAAAMNAARAAGVVVGPPVAPGELGAAALLHELAHALLAAFDWREAALAAVTARLGTRGTSSLLAALRERFPPPGSAVRTTPAAAAETDDGVSDEITIEELLLLGEARDNRALDAFVELFGLGDLASGGEFDAALTNLREVLRGVRVGPSRAAAHGAAAGPTAGDQHALSDDQGRAPRGDDASPAGGDLLAILRAPAALHPGSLLGQLEAALELWAPLIGERFAQLLRRALRGLDQLREERTFVAGPGPGGPAPVLVAGPGPGYLGEAAYSDDRAWMTGVVMVAKNAYVWLEQLSRRSGRTVARLDQVPDEELRELADHGFDTLWLVGVWQRSEASRTIKRLRGQPFAEASAYAIHDYVIAPDLGGEDALSALAERAARHGLRLASDMVPNHTGIDAHWVEERPDWFLRLATPPFDAYRFAGPDLTPGRAIEVRIEDGYYDGSDAAVVFERRERATGERNYVYHGNDGTAMPWNDTAQLDYLNPEVRAVVIDTIVAVARRFKVIRFDAAMTLVRRHVRRLWHPPPGQGGAIPSRSRHALEAEAFDRAMPHEFWREVVDEVARRAPDTLLVAEAFWLLESYFVRTLGVHRVYNSAFMHFLAAERNAEHRRLLRTTLASDPRDLERFVNYLTTPDEETAAETFGTGDKYFGAATMLATLPGLPLFGHGQVEGLREKYGMEFRAPRLDEPPDTRLQARHREVIAPLLARRQEFASAPTAVRSPLGGA